MASSVSTPVFHLVLFSFLPSATEAQIKEACDGMLALKDNCVQPESGAYIKAVRGGKQTSPESPFTGGFTHCFVFEFENAAHLDYYNAKDSVHHDLQKFMGPLIAKAHVLEFSPGQF